MKPEVAEEEEESLVRFFYGPNDAEEQPLIRVFLDPGSRAILASCTTEQPEGLPTTLYPDNIIHPWK